MQIRLLGDVDIVHNGRVIAIPGERRSSVLATLALCLGEVVSVAKIVDAVWDDAPPATARNTVQSHIAFLRKSIGLPDAIVHRQTGYALSLPAPGTDLASVEALITRADQAAGPQERVSLLRHALSCWRGSALQGVSGSSYLNRHREILEGLRLTTTEGLLVDRLRLGQHNESVASIEALVAQDPLRERSVQLLMIAHYRGGRTSEALAAYRRLQLLLRDEFGVQPSPHTARVHQRILRRDLALLVPTGQVTPTHRTEPRPSPVSRRLNRMVGRAVELNLALTLLDSRQLISLIGMGGVGKTRLALEVVRNWTLRGRTADFVDLTATDPAGLASFVASSLSVRQEPHEPIECAVASVLGSGDHLLVLDNCDLLVAEAATLVAVLLGLVPTLRVVVTSCEPLHVDGEECLLLTPLEVPDPQAPHSIADSPAVGLLVERARAADPAFVLSPDNEEALSELCRKVEGLPLALEIIAPRLRSLTARELADGLGERLLSWKDLRRGASDRHRSVGSLMDWTFSLLTESEAAALDSMSCLRGGGWLSEVVALCHPDPDLGEGLILGLIDRSLVIRTEVDHRTRVSLHSVVRAYAQSRLGAADQAAVAGERHACWVEGLVAATACRWHSSDEVQLLRWRSVDFGNIRAALEWRLTHHPERLTTLANQLWWYWYRTGEADEGLKWVQAALDAAGADQATVAVAHAAAGYLSWVVDQYAAAQEHATTALAMKTDDPCVAGFAHGVLARALGDGGDFEMAADHARRSISAYEQAGDRWGAAWSGRCLASALLYGARIADATLACDRARTEFEAIDDIWGVAGALDIAAKIAKARGEQGQALALARASLEEHRRCGDKSGERYTLQHLAESSWELGRLDACRRYAEQGLALAERHGYPVGALQALQLLEDVSTTLGEYDLAEGWRGRSERLVRLLGRAADVSLAIAHARRQAGLPRQ